MMLRATEATKLSILRVGKVQSAEQVRKKAERAALEIQQLGEIEILLKRADDRVKFAASKGLRKTKTRIFLFGAQDYTGEFSRRKLTKSRQKLLREFEKSGYKVDYFAYDLELPFGPFWYEVMLSW